MSLRAKSHHGSHCYRSPHNCPRGWWDWLALCTPSDNGNKGREAAEWTKHYVINIAGQSEQREALICWLKHCLHRFSFLTLQMSKEKLGQEENKKHSPKKSQRWLKAPWKVQGQRSMSEQSKVKAELAYLCKLKVSPWTMDGWFQLNCGVHVSKSSESLKNKHCSFIAFTLFPAVTKTFDGSYRLSWCPLGKHNDYWMEFRYNFSEIMFLKCLSLLW